MQNLVPLLPLPGSKKVILKIWRNVNASSTHKCGWRVFPCISFLIARVKRTSSQQRLLAVELVNNTTPVTIHHWWLHEGQDILVNKQCCLPYNINPFIEEVLCDVVPLEVCDVLLGQPYLWKRHVVYESIPCSVISTLGRQLYIISEVTPPIDIFLISSKHAVRSSPILGNLSSSLFALKAMGRL